MGPCTREAQDANQPHQFSKKQASQVRKETFFDETGPPRGMYVDKDLRGPQESTYALGTSKAILHCSLILFSGDHVNGEHVRSHVSMQGAGVGVGVCRPCGRGWPGEAASPGAVGMRWFKDGPR